MSSPRDEDYGTAMHAEADEWKTAQYQPDRPPPNGPRRPSGEDDDR